MKALPTGSQIEGISSEEAGSVLVQKAISRFSKMNI